MKNYSVSPLEINIKDALDLLPNSIANICIKKDYFISLIRDRKFNPLMVIIDTTNNMNFDKTKNYQLTKLLIRKFSKQKNWYNC